MAENSTPTPADALKLARGLSLLSNATRFPYIPDALLQYAKACVLSSRENRLTNAIRGERAVVFENINQMFRLASEATGLAPAELLASTDFDVHDMSFARLDAAFAELRSINFLYQQGFEQIRPRPAGRRKGADILAVLDRRLFAIEVAVSIFCADRRVEPVQLKQWLLGRVSADRKVDQLMQTATEVGAAALVLLGVIDALGAVTYNTHEDFVVAAELACNELGNPPRLHVALVTGRVALGHGPDDCVFPPWARNYRAVGGDS
jgi:hypothetical protein